MDLSKFSDSDVEALSRGDYASMSTEGLQMLAGGDKAAVTTSKIPAQPTTNDPVEFGVNTLKQIPGKVVGAVSDMTLEGTFKRLSGQPNNEAKTAVDEFLGVKNYAPKDGIQGATKGAIEGATDPLSYFGPGSIITKIFGGMAGGAGADVGQRSAEKLGFGTAGQAAGSIIGGITGAGSVAGSAITTKAGVEGAKLASKLTGVTDAFSSLGQASEAEATRQVQQVLREAIKADPNLESKIVEAINRQQATGINLPLSAILENRVVDAELRTLASKDPAFGELYSNQWKKAQDQLKSKQNSMFGVTAEEGYKKLTGIQEATVAKVNPNTGAVSGPVQKRLDALDERIAAEARNFKVPESGAIGSAMDRLLEAKEKIARAEASPKYREAFNILPDGIGTKLDPKYVETIYDFAASIEAQKLFTGVPQPGKKIVNKWAPKTDTSMGPNVPVYPDVTFGDLDNLKHAVNSAIASASNPEKRADLVKLKNLILATADDANPEFGKALKEADEFYRNAVGLPFNAAAVKSADKARYDENIVPLITRNKSALTEFLAAGGEDARKIAADALKYDLHKAAVKEDGVFNLKAADKWRQSKREQLSLFPELREELFGSGSVTSKLAALEKTKTDLTSQFNFVAKEKLLGLAGMDGKQLLSKIYTDHKFADKFLANNAPGGALENLQALRSIMLDDVLSNPNPTKYLQSPEKAVIFGKVFGPSYVNNVNKLAEVADLLMKDPAKVAVNLNKADKDILETMIPGMSVPDLSALIRRQLVSPLQKVVIGASKVQSATSELMRDSKLKQAFLNPSELRILLEDLRSIQSGKDITRETWNRVISFAVANGVQAGVTGTAVGINNIMETQ